MNESALYGERRETTVAPFHPIARIVDYFPTTAQQGHCISYTWAQSDFIRMKTREQIFLNLASVRSYVSSVRPLFKSENKNRFSRFLSRSRCCLVWDPASSSGHGFLSIFQMNRRSLSDSDLTDVREYCTCLDVSYSHLEPFVLKIKEGKKMKQNFMINVSLLLSTDFKAFQTGTRGLGFHFCSRKTDVKH